MTSLTPRQRVQITLQHQEPDRVPTAIGGGPYSIVDSLYYRLLEYYQLGKPVAPFRGGHNISYQDDRLFDHLGTDLRYVYPGDSPTSPSQGTQDPECFVDAFGQGWIRAQPYYYADRGLLAEASRIEQIEELVSWPDPSDPRWTYRVRSRSQALREGTNYWIVARMVASHGPYQTACDLRGMEQFMLDMVERPAFAEALLERVTETYAGLMARYLEACGAYIDMIELPGDDYAGNTNLIFSPNMFRRFIKPALKRLVETTRSVRPELVVMFHSDGAIAKLIPDLIELGIDVIHPLEPLPAMDLAEIKTKYGEQVSFLGGIDISHAMPGSLDDVVTEARRRIELLGPGGGYILAPSNHLQADVPAENVVALFEAARKYGKYPLERTGAHHGK